MMKSYLYYFVILAFLAGCVSVERRVEGNIIYSSYPNMELKISPDFNFISQKKEERDIAVEGGFAYDTSRGESFDQRQLEFPSNDN